MSDSTTPRPWTETIASNEIRRVRDGVYVDTIHFPNPHCCADERTDRINALRREVMAKLNAHDQLVAACRAVVALLDADPRSRWAPIVPIEPKLRAALLAAGVQP